jgi:hypothetical protein
MCYVSRLFFAFMFMFYDYYFSCFNSFLQISNAMDYIDVDDGLKVLQRFSWMGVSKVK